MEEKVQEEQPYKAKNDMNYDTYNNKLNRRIAFNTNNIHLDSMSSNKINRYQGTDNGYNKNNHNNRLDSDYASDGVTFNTNNVYGGSNGLQSLKLNAYKTR
jgi:hypothetical protein